jgi:DNA end-binding protein Ku
VQALEKTGKVAVAKVVIRSKQHLATVRPYKGRLLLETMYFADEVRAPESLDGELGGGKVTEAELEMARSLVENLSEPFDPSKYDDTYRKELLDLIKAKAKGMDLPEPREEEEAEVVDLMAALRESVQRTKRQSRATTSTAKRQSPRRGTAKTKKPARKAS